MESFDDLLAKAQRLTNEGRHVSSVRLALEALARAPQSERVLQLARVVVRAGMSRSSPGDSPPGEILTEALLADRLLDPLFSECDTCHGTWIDSSDLTAGAEHVSITNMVGGRCPRCQKVFCRNCYFHATLGVGTALIQCPNCKVSLTHLEAPTGRLARKLPPASGVPEAILVIREGMIPPDGQYIFTVFKTFYPELLSSRVQPNTIRGLAFDDWDGVAMYALGCAGALERGYLSDRFRLSPADVVLDGDRVYILRIFAAKTPTPARFELPELEGAPEQIAKGIDYMAGRLRRHVREAREIVRTKELAGAPSWSRLTTPEVLAETARALLAATRQSLFENKLMSAVAVFGEVAIAITTLPESSVPAALDWFPAGYVKELERLAEESGIVPGKTDFAHWTWGTDDSLQSQLHLTLLPAGAAFAFWAQDLMTPEEKRAVGLSGGLRR